MHRMYGEDWGQVGATHSFSHNSRDILTPARFELEEEQFKPAIPFY